MSTEVKIPAVGESITSGVLSVWHKQTGDIVSEGEALFTLETDKISTEIPSVAPGKLQIKVEAGQEVKIGQVVALLDESIKAPAQKAKPTPEGAKPSPPAGATALSVPAGSNETLSPAARRIVEEEKVDPAEVTGTGKRGQVTKSDLVQYLESKTTSPSAVPPGDQAPLPSEPVQSVAAVPPSRRPKQLPGPPGEK